MSNIKKLINYSHFYIWIPYHYWNNVEEYVWVWETVHDVLLHKKVGYKTVGSVWFHLY